MKIVLNRDSAFVIVYDFWSTAVYRILVECLNCYCWNIIILLRVEQYVVGKCDNKVRSSLHLGEEGCCIIVDNLY